MYPPKKCYLLLAANVSNSFRQSRKIDSRIFENKNLTFNSESCSTYKQNWPWILSLNFAINRVTILYFTILPFYHLTISPISFVAIIQDGAKIQRKWVLMTVSLKFHLFIFLQLYCSAILLFNHFIILKVCRFAFIFVTIVWNGAKIKEVSPN